MRRFLFLLMLCFSGVTLFSQNVQLHYDLGEGRNYLTSTVEMFKPDRFGSSFFFIDMDYSSMPGVKGVSMAYWEFARALKFWDAPVAFHTEYNGGFGQWREGEASGAYQIDDAFLNGVEFSLDAEDYSKGLTLQVLHKYIRGKHDFSFQLTGVWYLQLLNNKVSFTGFADFWREDNLFISGTKETKTRFVFLSEPQLWYNFNKNLALGSEVEISGNFGGFKGVHFYPTLGLKYTL